MNVLLLQLKLHITKISNLTDLNNNIYSYEMMQFKVCKILRDICHGTAWFLNFLQGGGIKFDIKI